MQIHKLLCSLEGTRPTQTSPVLRESEASRRHNGWLISTLGVASTESERCRAGSKRWANCRAALTALVPLRIGHCHSCNIRDIRYPLVSKLMCAGVHQRWKRQDFKRSLLRLKVWLYLEESADFTACDVVHSS